VDDEEEEDDDDDEEEEEVEEEEEEEEEEEPCMARAAAAVEGWCNPASSFINCMSWLLTPPPPLPPLPPPPPLPPLPPLLFVSVALWRFHSGVALALRKKLLMLLVTLPKFSWTDTDGCTSDRKTVNVVQSVCMDHE